MMAQKRAIKFTLSFDPLTALAGPPKVALQKFPSGLDSLWSVGQWAWNIGQWKSFEDFELAWRVLEKVLQRCVEKQQDAWFCKGHPEIERKDVRDIEWLDDGFRRGLHHKVLDEFLTYPAPKGEKKVTVEDLSSHQLGASLVKFIQFDPSRLYWANAVISIDRALIANNAGDLKLLVAHSIEAAESLRAGLGVYDASKARIDGEARMGAEREMSSKDFARYGAMVRHEPMNNVKRIIQAAYLSGRWKSKLQAARILVPLAREKAIEHGTRLSNDRGEATVYGWIRALAKPK